MRKNVLAILGCLFIINAPAQTIKKMPVGNSGCSVYSYCELEFDMQYSEDSAQVYTAECEKDSMHYGVINVKLHSIYTNLDSAESILTSYMDYLKTAFKVKKSAGYGRGHQLKASSQTRGILDYWEDEDKLNWKVKGWTNGSFISVLYCYSAKELNETKINLFLDGLRYPGM